MASKSVHKHILKVHLSTCPCSYAAVHTVHFLLGDYSKLLHTGQIFVTFVIT